MQAHSIHPFFNTLYQRISAYAGEQSLWQNKAQDLKTRFEQDNADLDTALTLAHEAQRVIKVHAAGLETSKAFVKDLANTQAPIWPDFQEPPAEEEMQDGLVDMLYYDSPDPDTDRPIFALGDQARYVGRRLVEKALDDGLDFQVNFVDPNFGALLMNHADANGIDGLARDKLAQWANVTKVIHCDACTPRETLLTPDSGKMQELRNKTGAIDERKMRGEIGFRLTVIPTEADAELDGFDDTDYTRLFFELCDQPWPWIEQAHHNLIPKLDAAQTLHIANDDGTDITLDLIDDDGEPFTFCDSRTQRNIPGSEVFSAPRRNGVNGTIVANGQFSPGEGKIIKNLTLHFDNGYLYDFTADEGAEHFQEFLDRNPLHRYVGELGIGTNPHLKRHVLNGLLVEKISGSFHVALGKCYAMTEYDGAPVHVDNGNSDPENPPEHWDITTMLFGKSGKMTINKGCADEQVIMENGLFSDRELDVLNRGWAAVPVDARPDYWKNYQGPEYGLGAPRDMLAQNGHSTKNRQLHNKPE